MIRCIYNENRNIAGETARIDRMGQGLKMIVSEHWIVAGDHEPVTLDRITCLFDGILDNELELKQSLGLDRECETEEVLIRLYQKTGKHLVHQMKGKGILLIMDQDKLMLFRDPLGISTGYIARKMDGELLISDRLRGIFNEGSIQPVIYREDFLRFFMFSPSHPDGMTCFRNIQELPSGSVMSYQKGKTEIEKYFELKAHRHTEDRETTRSHLRFLLRQSLNRQSQTIDASFLSGGLDSTILTSMLSIQKPVKTYSLDYQGNDRYFISTRYQKSLDGQYISQAQHYFNSRHTSFTITPKECCDGLCEAMEALEYPGMADIDSSLLWLYREVSHTTEGILSGECADELLGGYPWFSRQELMDSPVFPWMSSVKLRADLLHPDFRHPDLEARLKQWTDKEKSLCPVHPQDSEQDVKCRQMMFLTIRWFMPTLIRRQEAMARAAGLVVRNPFADPELMQYCFDLPYEYKVSEGQEKAILREAFKGLIPESVRTRKKNPYPKTHHPEYTRLVKEELRKRISDPDCLLLKLLDHRKLIELIENEGTAMDQPWFGQLMRGPQLLATLIQMDEWLKSYHIRCEF